MPDGIFISYRREDSRHAAGRLRDTLADVFPSDNIFMDVDNIALGYDFHDELDKRLSECEVMLVIIGPRWLDAKDDENRRRIAAENDFVRLEIETALNRNIRVIPILFDGAAMPGKDDLPAGLHGLLRRQGTRINHESFASDTGRLVDSLLPRPPQPETLGAKHQDPPDKSPTSVLPGLPRSGTAIQSGEQHLRDMFRQRMVRNLILVIAFGALAGSMPAFFGPSDIVIFGLEAEAVFVTALLVGAPFLVLLIYNLFRFTRAK